MQMGNAQKEGETLLSYTPNMGRKLLRLAKLEVNIVKKRQGGGGIMPKHGIYNYSHDTCNCMTMSQCGLVILITNHF